MLNRSQKSFLWQPHATSTPLKPFVSQNKCKTYSQSEAFNPSEELINVLLSKSHKMDESDQNKAKSCKNKTKSCKNKASIYFDVSSSSEEEYCDANSRKVEIKINATSSIRIKELEKSEILERNLMRSNRSKNIKTDFEAVKENNSKAKSLPSVSTSNKIKNKSVQNDFRVNTNGSKKNNYLALCGQFFDKVNTNEQISAVIESKPKAKGNYFLNSTHKSNKSNKCIIKANCESETIKYARYKSKSQRSAKDSKPTCKSDTEASLFSTECMTHSVLTEINTVKKSCSTSCNFNENLDKNKKIAMKCKSKRIIDENIPEKRVKKDVCNKKNSSHQLFSDSMEQELLNSLNLTITDPNDKQNNLNSQKQSSKITEANNVKVEVKSEAGSKEAYSKEAEQRHSSLVKDQIINCDFENSVDLKSRNSPCSPNSKHQIKSPVVKQLAKNVSLKNDHIIKNNTESVEEKATKKLVLENFEVTPQNKTDVNKNIDNELAINIQSEPEKNTKLNKVVKRNVEDLKIKESKSKNKCRSAYFFQFASSNSDVFKQLHTLSSFEEFKPGCFFAECWSFENFKCGMLRLKPNTQHLGKTKYKNSFFGGVIIKGKLKMRIGNKKLELNEGDMSFVPPLTQWLAVNVYETDVNMYYWCGRF